ncbi:MAG: hypothetical protein R3C49_03475 [Planctomycetaceae bacterium]
MLTRFFSLALLLPISVAAVADESDDLFSTIRNGSVFQSESSNSASGVPERITSGEQLRDMLQTAGFTAKLENSRQVTTEKVLDPWTLPVLVEISDDETQVSILLGLNVIDDVDRQLPADRLLKLMAASSQYAPAMFVYSSDRERTELRLTMKNQDLSGQFLRDEINRLAVIARDTSETWSLPKPAVDDTPEVAKPNTETPTQASAAAPAATPPATAQSAAPESAPPTLTGRWSAARSDKEAFAIEFLADSRFNLVYVNNGTQTKSSGSFSVTQSNLALTGSDGIKLQGTFATISPTRFRFEPSGSDALEFQKAAN